MNRASGNRAVERYFFNIFDGFTYLDEVGTEYPSLETAQSHAVKIAAELLAPEASDIWNGQDWSLEVTDTQKAVLFTLQFSAVVKGSSWQSAIIEPYLSRANSAEG